MEELLKKLRYKAGPAAILHAPEGYAPGFGEQSPADGATYGFVQLFVRNSGELAERAAGAIALLEDDAVFWITYPKASSGIKSDVNRDTLAAWVQEHTAYRPVSNVAVDDTWSALRFREKSKVKASK
ncbi:hypothetical protein B5M42_022025 [Paenibacillus athensensis]|uniref:DUF3052 domain-containing protein n=1 Tax=Paenibacillus athensensis TaxID=1967502 RepID=A0A4Y8PWG4_9BACL|nr:hypothetical protein [Paenibacillus athensensis]MCD1261484.1 hypothetical protein [Paenibacillus athensensis]